MSNHTELIHLWSGPRCVSTSLMYSFSQRCDTQCIDEPLYAHYLRRTGFTRPYQQDLFASQEKDGGAAMAKLRAMQQEPSTKPLLFIKHMAKMKYGLNNDALFSGPDKHVLLVRDPYQVITSFARVLENPTLLELGYSSLLEIVSELRSRGKPIIILLSDQLVKHPEATLRRLCGLLEIPFLQEMLSWPPGPKPCDGLWAPWWYENSHKSTCFEASVQTIGREPMPDHLKPLLSECSVIYNLLKKSALIFDVPPSPSLSSSDEVLSTHSFATDARNNNVLVMIRDGLDKSERLVVRDQAQVSVFESAFLMGDGVWEGLRVHKGCPLFLEDHLERLYEGALALDMTMDLHQTQVEGLINECLQANGMTGNDHIHIRLCVSRGVKSTPYQSPYLPTQLGSPTIVIIPEYKNPSPQVITRGLKLFTVHVRRGDPSVQDPGLNSHSKGNCIQGCIQVRKA